MGVTEEIRAEMVANVMSVVV
ncbi:MAG: hypothetical protein QOD96_3457, partial [Pseudonocardiales bacterium]|nr:hypothetical protein [Pseudonocardiales bacterium]